MLIKTSDLPHVEPRDFLVSGRVTKRHTRPLTVAEVQQRNRLLVLQKLDYEIKQLQHNDTDVQVTKTLRFKKDSKHQENITTPVRLTDLDMVLQEADHID